MTKSSISKNSAMVNARDKWCKPVENSNETQIWWKSSLFGILLLGNLMLQIPYKFINLQVTTSTGSPMVAASDPAQQPLESRTSNMFLPTFVGWWVKVPLVAQIGGRFRFSTPHANGKYVNIWVRFWGWQNQTLDLEIWLNPMVETDGVSSSEPVL